MDGVVGAGRVLVEEEDEVVGEAVRVWGGDGDGGVGGGGEGDGVQGLGDEG